MQTTVNRYIEIQQLEKKMKALKKAKNQIVRDFDDEISEIADCIERMKKTS